MKTITLSEAKRLNKEAGQYFWSKETKAYFNHRDESRMLKGNYFICSSTFTGSDHENIISYELNKFDPETGKVKFLQRFKTLEQAKEFYKSII